MPPDTAPVAAPAPDAPLAPASSDLLQAPPALTVEQAQAKRAELFGKAGFAQRVAAGDPEASKLWREVTRALRPPVDKSTIEGKQYAKNMDSLSILRAKAELSEARNRTAQGRYGQAAWDEQMTTATGGTN